jgi:plasmid stabilization system protein ParE
MKRFRLSSEAARDIREIRDYIAKDDLRAAGRVRLQILGACRALAMNPAIGHKRQDITDKPVLFWPVGSYLVVYQYVDRFVEIIRVIHAARDAPNIL